MNNLSNIKRHFKQVDPIIYRVVQSMDYTKWLVPRSKKRNMYDYFGALCRDIIGQQLSGKVADIIFDRFQKLYQHDITPEKVLATKEQALRDIGLSWAKVSYVKDLATKSVAKEINYNQLSRLDKAEVIKELTQVKGIGLWTAEMFLLFTLSHDDIYSHGDLGLKKGMQKLYRLKDMPTKKQAFKITIPWKPYRSYGSMALWQSLDNK